jgi:hypothetical protein
MCALLLLIEGRKDGVAAQEASCASFFGFDSLLTTDSSLPMLCNFANNAL